MNQGSLYGGPLLLPARCYLDNYHGIVPKYIDHLNRNLAPPTTPEIDYFIVIIGEEHRDLALAIAHAQRDRGAGVQYALRDQSVRKQFVAAGNAGAREVVVLGPDEVARGRAVVRDMASGAEREVPLEELQ